MTFSQVQVIQKVDNAIHWIAQVVSLILIGWIVIYPADSAIHLFNNRGQISLFLNGMHGSDGFQLQFREKTNVSFSN